MGNPTSGLLTIEMVQESGPEAMNENGPEEKALAEVPETGVFGYALYDMVGNPVKVDRSSSQKSTIDTTSLRKGMYHLKIIHDRKVIDRTVLVE